MIYMSWLKNLFRMKTNPWREQRIKNRHSNREREYIEIHARWSELNLSGDAKAVEKTAQEFGCGKDKVLTAISFMIGFGKQGTKGRR